MQPLRIGQDDYLKRAWPAVPRALCEASQVACEPQPSEAFGGFLHGGCGPAQGHGRRAPALHVAADTPHRGHHILDNVGTGERAPKLLRQTQPRDCEEISPSGTLRARACARYGVLVVGEESYRDFRQKYARATSHKLKPSGASRQTT